jgi:carbonic anhydrase
MTSLLSRRKFLALTGVTTSGAVLAACAPGPKAPVYVPVTPTPRGPDKLESGAALDRLTAGNIRFVSQQMRYPDQSAERRAQAAQAQSPFAAVLCCSDSRVPPEVIFDQGLGDLYVVRVAGNVTDDPIIGSLEYGAEQLGLSLIVVLGHTQCGAVRAALEAFYLGAGAPAHINSLVQAIEPAVQASQAQPGDPWRNAVTANIHLTVARLQSSPPTLAQKVKAQELQIVGALYNLDTGWVEFLPARTK